MVCATIGLFGFGSLPPNANKPSACCEQAEGLLRLTTYLVREPGHIDVSQPLMLVSSYQLHTATYEETS